MDLFIECCLFKLSEGLFIDTPSYINREKDISNEPI